MAFKKISFTFAVKKINKNKYNEQKCIRLAGYLDGAGQL